MPYKEKMNCQIYHVSLHHGLEYIEQYELNAIKFVVVSCFYFCKNISFFGSVSKSKKGRLHATELINSAVTYITVFCNYC